MLMASVEDENGDKSTRYLISQQVKLNLVRNDNGYTAAMMAAENGSSKALKLLIEAGADLNICDSFGWNALSIAILNKQDECAKLLLGANAINTGPPKFHIAPYFTAEKEATESQDVDEMKIQTMYKMVDECRVITQGKEVVKKVLYLTNKQAVMFDEDAMDRAVQALDIGQPKFVIKLMASIGVASQAQKAHSEMIGTMMYEFQKCDEVTSEISQFDDRVVENSLLLFMKTCILPLAMQTRALILVNGANDCFLSATLAQVALAEQARLGKDCPFTVICTVWEGEVHAKAISSDPKDLNSVASQIARQSPSWQKRIQFMNDFYSNLYLPKGERLQQCDITEAASRYIIFEGYEETSDGKGFGVRNSGPQRAFESIFLQHMTKKLPSIAIQCCIPTQGLPFLVDLTSRNIPVLLLDTRERCFTANNHTVETPILTKLAKMSDAFPTITQEQYDKIQIVDGALSEDSKNVLLEAAIEMVERHMEVMIDNNTIDMFLTSLLAFFHSVLTLDNEVGTLTTGSVPLWMKVKEMEKLERTSKDLKKNIVSSEMLTKVLSFIQNRVTALEVMCKNARIEHWIQNHPKKYQHFVSEAVFEQIELKKVIDQIDKDGGVLANNEMTRDNWLAIYDLLSSPNTFSGSVYDFDEIKRILGSVAKIDRLPNANSLEALRILQDAWDRIEVYNEVAQSYKVAAKISYIVLLIVGIIINSFAMSASKCPDQECLDSKIRSVVIIVSFLGAAFQLYISYTNPAIRWQQLRMAALSIESSIWTFRTRAGQYRTTGEGFDNSSEKILSNEIKEVKQKVLEGADIKQTAFFSRVKSQNKHGQHPTNTSSFGALDNFAKISPFLDLKQPKDKYIEVSQKQNSISNSLSSKKSAVESNQDLESQGPHYYGGITHHGTGGGMKTIKEEKINYKEPEYQLVDVIASLKRDHAELDQLTIDTHYEPLQPDAYIRFRLLPALNFYKERIPKCNNVRNITQFLLLLGTFGTSGMAILNIVSWAGIITILSVSITAYLEFSGTNTKISRYSFTVHSLQELVYWWQTLPQIDRSVVSNIDRLVLTCEELLQREQQAWRSTSQSVKLLQQQSMKDSSGNVNSVASAADPAVKK